MAGTIAPVGTDRKPLEVQNLELWFPGGKAPALLDVNINLLPGTVTAIIGPAGVGKSTLFKAILNEIAICGGSIKVDGVEVVNGKPLDPELYSYVPQKTNLMSNLTVWETLELAAYARLPNGRNARDRFSVISDVLSQLNMEHKRDSYVRDLSGGEERRVSIALELLSSPRLLLLDEPTTGLDEGLDKELHEILRRVADGPRKPAVLFVTHSTTHIDMVDPVSNRPLVDNVIAIGKAAKDSPTATVRHFGRPNQIFRDFNARTYAEVMDKLRSDPPYPVAIPTTRPKFKFKHAHKTVSGFRSIVYSVWRQWLLVGRAKGLAKSMLMRTLIGVGIALALLAVSRIGLGGSMEGPNEKFLTYTSTLVLLLAITATALPVMGIVNAWNVIQREQRWGVSARSFVVAQMFIQLFQILPLVAATTALSLLLTDRPTDQTLLPQVGPFPEYWQLFALLLLATLAAYGVGTLIGTSNTSTYKANLATTFAFAIMLVGNGLIIPWPTNPFIYYPSFLIPSRSGIAMVASNFNAEQAMTVVSDDAFNLSRDDFHMLMGFVALVAVVLILFALYYVRHSLHNLGGGAGKAATVTGQNTAQDNSVGSGAPKFVTSLASMAVVALMIVAVVGQYVWQEVQSEDADPPLAPAVPTVPAGTTSGNQPQQQTSNDVAQAPPGNTDLNNQQAAPTAPGNEQASEEAPPIIDAETAPTEPVAEDASTGEPATSEPPAEAEADATEPDGVAEEAEPEQITSALTMESTPSAMVAASLPANAVYVDIGGSGEPESLNGFSVNADDLSDRGDAWGCTLGGYTDYTKRDQEVQSSGNPWAVVPLQVNSLETVTLTFCIEEGESGTDYWELWLGGDRPEEAECTEVLLTKPDSLTPGLNTISVEIPAKCVPSERVLLVFTSQANDGNGLWGILVEQNSAATAEETGTDTEMVAEEESNTDAEEISTEEVADAETPSGEAIAAAEVSSDEEAGADEMASAGDVEAESAEAEDTSENDVPEESATQPAIEPIGDVVAEESVPDSGQEASTDADDSSTASEENQIVAVEDSGQPEDSAVEEPSEEPAVEESTEEPVAEAPTEEPTAEPTVEPTEEPLPPVDPMPANATYIDIGGNEPPGALTGFSSEVADRTEQGDAWSCKLGGDRDYTSRSQVTPTSEWDKVTVTLNVTRLQQTTLTFCIEEAESSTGSWEIRLDSESASHIGCEDVYLKKPSNLTPGVNEIEWVIPPDCILEDQVVVEFVASNHDGMSIWGVRIEQDPMITAEPPQEPEQENLESTPDFN